jgi:nitrite reductase/ring-hydroxylating ferredoxin subunit
VTEHVVCEVEELPPGGRVVTDVNGLEVGVFNVDGEYYAFPNWCPHQGGPLCEGPVGGTTAETFDRDSLSYDLRWVKEGAILRCPWHQWEFDMEDNCFRHDTDRSLPSYPVHVEDGKVVLSR